MDIPGLFAVGGLAALLVIDSQLQLRSVRPPRLTRPRHEPDQWRCPYCHQAVMDGARTRCTACGTRHHSSCWEEHGGCSVHACGSLQGRTFAAPPAPAPEPEPATLPEVPAPDATVAA